MYCKRKPILGHNTNNFAYTHRLNIKYFTNTSKSYVHLGIIWLPLEPKAESHFSQISLDWLIRRITQI